MLSVVGLTYFSGASIPTAFPTQDHRGVRRLGGRSPALIAMAGPPIALDTLAGIVMNKVAIIALLAPALVAVLTVVRHTRGEEEEGRSEMLRATVVGRHAGSVAALLLTAGLCAVLGAGTAFALLGSQVPASASWSSVRGHRAGAGVGRRRAGRRAGVHARPRPPPAPRSRCSGWSTWCGRSATCRAAGWCWLSPVGWVQATHPLGDERWWPLLVPLAAVGLLVGVAVALANRRDVGAGLVVPRDGPAVASRRLSGPVRARAAAAARRARGWAAGLFLLSAAMGSLSREVGGMARGNATLEKYLAAPGRAR